MKLSAVVDPMRVRRLNEREFSGGSVIYWMSRDQRMADNWALLYAQRLALEHRVPLGIVFCLLPRFLGATLRQYEFMLKGLEQIESGCRKAGISFTLLTGAPEKELTRFVARESVGAVVTDFTALRANRQWKDKLTAHLRVPLHEVDAHNIVPCWVASSNQEFAAYTLRPKIRRLLPSFLTDFPRLGKHPHALIGDEQAVDWSAARKSLRIDRRVEEVEAFIPGETAARKALRRFLDKKLERYDQDRNQPQVDGQSNLSPYLHFGQISAQRVALETMRNQPDSESTEAFIEELVVRRELSDNFCHYNDRYDTFAGFPAWAQKTLNEHRSDLRRYVYPLEQFEQAQTHDRLWNAAQSEMVNTGKMHGYLRMYWAKKILEWSASPEEALATAIYLNDRYELDGRDPNGYAGIAWSIGGVHDRAWGSREIFGKIRYMSYEGCARKFDVKAYISRHTDAEGA